MTKKIFHSGILFCAILLGPSIPASAQTPPLSPTLSNAAAGNRQITLAWIPAATAAGYKVKHGTTPGSYPNIIDVGNVTSFIVNSLMNNTSYYFVVTAYNAGGESGPSNELSAQPFHVPAVYSNDLCNNGVSSASSCLGGCSSGYSHAQAFDNVFNVWDGWVAQGVPTGWLQYNFSSPETIAKYTINPRGAVAGNPRNWTFEAYNAANSQWVVLDTRVNQTWTYQVSREYSFSNTNTYTQYRLNASANGGHNEVGLTEMEMMRLITAGAPSTITNLQAQAPNASVALTWDEPTSGGSPITSYQIQYGLVSSVAFHSTYIDDNVPGATISGLANNTAYQFRVVAVNAVSNSDPSNIVTATPGSGTLVSGSITANTTWNSAGNPYVVVGNTTVAPSVTLTITPGTQIKFDGNYTLAISGTLNAQGASGNLITFTSNRAAPARADWNKISLGNGTNSTIDYVKVEYSADGIESTSGTSTIQNSIFENNTNGILASGGDPNITTNSFQNNTTGISIITSSPTVQYNSIHNNTGSGLSIQTSAVAPNVHHNTIFSNPYGIYIRSFSGTMPAPPINNNSIYGNTVYNLFLTSITSSIDYSSQTINAENNWWGTADPAAIMNGIFDYSDSNLMPTADMVPFLDGPGGNPVPGEFIHGAITANTTWGPANNPYIIIGNTGVLPAKTLTLSPGVEIKFNGNDNFIINGILNAVGTPQSTIKFTSNRAAPAKGDWRFLRLNNTSTLRYAIVEYADYGIDIDAASPVVRDTIIRNNNRGLNIGGPASPAILNNTISNNNYGLYLDGWQASYFNGAINNNSIDNNTNYNLYLAGGNTGVSINASQNWWGSADYRVIKGTIWDNLDDINLPTAVFTPFWDAPNGNPVGAGYVYGAITSNTIWSPANNPYLVIGNTTVRPGVTLTIDPGTLVKFDGFYGMLVKGALNSSGASGNIIRFTSSASTPAVGDWSGIRIEGQTPASTIDHTEIKYADIGLYIYYGSPPVSNSSFQNNNIGLRMAGTSTSLITNNVFDNNVNYGMQLLSGLTVPPPTPEIHNNSFLNNMQYDLRTDMTGINFNHSGTIIDAEYNWWGTADPVQISASIYDYFDQNYRPRVDYAPYLVSPPGQSIFITNNSVTRRFFNPVRSETAQINYTLSEAADVTIKIFDDSQTLVRTLLNNQPKSSGSNSDVWDGRDDNAQLLPDGTYKYTIYASNASGHAGLYDPFDPILREANISNVSISPAASFNPSQGERLRIQYDLNAPARVTFKFAFYSPYVDNELRDAGTNIDYWDGRSDDGSILDLTTPGAVFEVQATNTQVLEPNIIVLKQSTTLDVPVLVTDPYVIRPLNNEITEITYAITENATVSVSILTPNGNTVLTVLEGPVSKTAGTYTLVWDGRTSSGDMVTDDGDYRVQVEGIDSSGVSFIRDGNIRIMY